MSDTDITNGGIIKVFGYGSLLDEEEIRWHTGKREVLICETVIWGYKRDWEAYDGRYRYLGIHKVLGWQVNGLVFELERVRIGRFLEHEGWGKLYDFKEINSGLWSLVTKKPSRMGADGKGR